MMASSQSSTWPAHRFGNDARLCRPQPHSSSQDRSPSPPTATITTKTTTINRTLHESDNENSVSESGSRQTNNQCKIEESCSEIEIIDATDMKNVHGARYSLSTTNTIKSPPFTDQTSRVRRKIITNVTGDDSITESINSRQHGASQLRSSRSESDCISSTNATNVKTKKFKKIKSSNAPSDSSSSSFTSSSSDCDSDLSSSSTSSSSSAAVAASSASASNTTASLSTEKSVITKNSNTLENEQQNNNDQISGTSSTPKISKTSKSASTSRSRAGGAGGMNLRKRKPVQAIATTKKIRKNTRIEKLNLNPEVVADHGRDILFTSSCYRLRRKPTIKDLFPLRSVGGVLALFKAQLIKEIDGQKIEALPEPDLLMLSVVMGMLEERFTNGSPWIAEFDPHNSAADLRLQNVPVVPGYVKGRRLLEMPVPPIHWCEVEDTMQKFITLIKESVDLTQYSGPTSRELIKRISEVIWSNLLRSYQRDKLHIQTIYSFVESKRLDAFGVAYSVVAACQLLDIHDVRLVLSEDHSWVEFGPDGETCEVTWHGRQGGDEMFGLPIPTDKAFWIYQNGHSLTCNLKTTVAALVTSINATTTNNNESEELATLQHQLLWFMHDIRLLNRYPIAIGTLADLEDTLMPDFPRREPIELFHEAIVSAKKYYNDSHVYPYTYLAGFHFRNGRFKAALRYWGDSAQVMKHYKHNRHDEEIYKEFQEIGNELIPYLIKFVSNNDLEPSMDHYLPHLEDPECFAFLLQFYDGLCLWEEGSQTPVLHVGWTKYAVTSIAKFSISARSQLSIKFECSENDQANSDIDDTTSEDNTKTHSSSIGERRRKRAASINLSSEFKPTKSVSSSSRQSPEVPDDNDDLSEEDMNLSSNVSSDGSGTHVTLYSKKMAGLKNLLIASKMNASAIQLQLTAQSQVNVNRRSRNKISSAKNELDFVAIATTNLTRTSSNASTCASGENVKRARRT